MEKGQCWLVVGDGNFSFSLSLLRAVPDIKLITSTLNSRIDDPTVIKNVEALERQGVVVLHEVDATKLSQCTYLTERRCSFDVIVFNFPHSGGKSNIIRNRELLCGFFKSATLFLNENGEIHTTLCRGQGGTLMDCTKRGYNNSWKIVEMAAFSNLILSRVEPFPKELYPSYSPTGYRGLSKGFSLEGAMRHIFRFPQVDKTNWFSSAQGYSVCECCGKFACSKPTIPAQLQDAMCYPLLCHSWHPVAQIKKMLVEQINSSFLSHGNWTECTENPYLKIHQVPSHCIPIDISYKLETLAGYCPLCMKMSCCTEPIVCNDGHTFHTFFPSVELYLPKLLSQISHNGTIPSLQLLCSPVVSNIDISMSMSSQSVLHELIGVIPLEVDVLGQRLELQVLDILENILKKSPGHSQEPCKFIYDQVSGIYVQDWKVVTVENGRSIMKLGALSAEANRYFVFIFPLESLTMIYYGISDVRLLRSKDVHFSTQFIRNPVLKFMPFCLNTPSYVHDISFWYTSSESHVSSIRHKLSSVIKEITGDVVVDLSCIDVYPRPNSTDTSYCFRITYKHYDQPLSQVQANALQLMIRDALSKDFEITLR